MEPVIVPAPPKSAFNESRRVSDLLFSQLQHFQHVAHKRGIQIDPAVEGDIQTEAGAARYITRITRAIRNQAQFKPAVTPFVPTANAGSGAGNKSMAGLALAAAATPASKPKTKATKTGKRVGKGKKP